MTSETPVPIDELLAERAWVRGLAGALLRDVSDADDLAQDAWESALRTPPRSGGSVRAWFATVLRNRARDRRRDAARRDAAMPPAGDVADALASRQPTPAALAERAETERRVLDIVVSLDEAHRDVVLLRFWRGLGAEEIARLRGIAPATARTRLHRALAEIRDRLDRASGGRDAWHAALAPVAAGGTGAAGGGATAGASGGAGASATRRSTSGSGPESAAATPTGSTALARAALVAAAVIAILAAGAAGLRTLGEGEATATVRRLHARSRRPRVSRRRTLLPRPARREPARRHPPRPAPPGEEGAGADPPAAADAAPAVGPAVLRVRVRDASRRPVAGARVVVLRDGKAGAAAPEPRREGAPSGVAARDATPGAGEADLADPATPQPSDASGELRFRWPDRAAEVRVLAQHEHGAGLSSALRPPPAGATVEAEIVLGDAVPVRGVVLGPTGAPHQGARVTLSGSFDDAYAELVRTTTDAAGRFDFGPIPRALATREGSLETAAAGFPRVWTELARQTDPGALTIRLEVAMVVTGRLVDEAGAPVPDVSVDVTGASTVFSGSDGRFRAEPLPPAAARVVVLPDDHAPTVVVLDDAVSGDRDVGDVVLRPGRPIRGRVVTEDGAPAPRAFVFVDDVTVDQIVRQGQADDEGRFVFEHLGPGPHVVQAQARPGAGGDAGHEGQADGVRGGDEDVRVVVGPGRSVLVELVDDATGAPVGVSGLRTSLVLGSDPNVGARSSYGGEDLRSVRISVRRDGTYELRVEAAGFEPFGPVRVDVVAREERRVTARLRRKTR